MLTSLNKLNTSILAFAADTFEEGMQEAAELKSAVSTLFHEDTPEFYIDYDLFAQENNWS